jgi:hypothetical protein
MPAPADQIYWGLAYGKALAVDGADVLLTLAFLRKVSEEKHGWDYIKILFIILFIFGFTGFSWYINWQYEIQFVTNEFALADKQFFFNHNVGTSNPLVGSAFQLFALVFTFISDTILKKTETKTAAQLEAEAGELERLKKAQDRIKAINKGRVENASIDAIDSGFHVLGHLKKKAVETLSKNKQSHVQNGTNEQSNTDENANNLTSGTASNTDDKDVQSGNQSGGDESFNTGKTPIETDKWAGFTSRSTVSLEKASELLGVTINTISELRRRGVLKTAALNNQLITIASIKAYDRKRSNRGQSRKSGETKPRLRVVGDE